MTTGPERDIEQGQVEPELEREFPGLALPYMRVDRGSGRSPRAVKNRLRELSDRFGGSQAIALRTKPIPWSYRVFFRHIGLDPDEQPTPVEQAALDRIRDGSFRSQNLLDDALTIATVESGVGMVCFDADRSTGELMIRQSRKGDQLEGRPGDLPIGTLVICDQERPLALLFGAVASGRGVNSKTSRMIIAAIQVGGVPAIVAEEALWLVSEVLDAA